MNTIKIISMAVLILVGSTSDAQNPRVVLLDLGGLFYKFSTMSYVWELGPLTIASHAMLDFKHPKGLEKTIFGILRAIDEDEIRAHSDEFKNSVWYTKLQESSSHVKVPQLALLTRSSKGNELPYLINAFQAGHISPHAALSIASKKLAEVKGVYRMSDREVSLVEHAFKLIFDPAASAAMSAELSDGTKLLYEIKKAQINEDGSKKFLLVALSNVEKETARIIEKQLKNVFAQFDHVFYSGDLGTVKPNDEAFALTMDELNKVAFTERSLRTDEILFMDDQAENIVAAKRVGIKDAILYKNAVQAREELVKLGILAPKIEAQSAFTVKNAVFVGTAAAGLYVAYQHYT